MIENFMESSKYAQNLFKIRNEIIQDIKNESLDENVPIITDEVLNYMIFTARNIKARNILEIGTATGYSGLFLAQIANENSGFLTTMEIDEIRYGKAVENFKKLGLFEKNKMIFGDALEEIPKLDKNVKYDFIFIDASKGQYLKFFEMSYELLNENGIIFIDNLMFRGLVAADKEEIPKRYKTIVRRLKEFIEKLNEEYNFVLLPFGDGVGIVKK
ncbi:O-methyltransferase [Leptotrichia buccalis]|uniref:tRNA 5-hydroxyuridine methyltransferase n=1 Tax=Leptotrichia buccalis (strain ATCC 14201 / DSM 1135 / JCM 12969 / NCTC 10249 / C-1013-b) TaxID=523794 RepID=C7N8Q8_LEPBD|nr:O-methyltransferase [Leptotrichia buccalis]ACV38539.1 O-methyltransferase family 3 [Leptotrichia buccalis C-1013-b]